MRFNLGLNGMASPIHFHASRIWGSMHGLGFRIEERVLQCQAPRACSMESCVMQWPR